MFPPIEYVTNFALFASSCSVKYFTRRLTPSLSVFARIMPFCLMCDKNVSKVSKMDSKPFYKNQDGQVLNC